jgi:hypothetical protein
MSMARVLSSGGLPMEALLAWIASRWGQAGGQHEARELSAMKVVGWIAVVISAALTCLWTFWGIIENFHEGWYHRSLVGNLAMMMGQYLAVPVVFLVMALVGIRWPRIGGLLHGLAGCCALWFFRGASWPVLVPFITAPLMLLGAGYWYGRPEPPRRASLGLVAVALLTLIISGARPAWIVANRIDDGDRGARVVDAGTVRLEWAPAGPGWPDMGVTWNEAVRRSAHLSEDGLSLTDTPLSIWRLPTIEEAVASQSLHGRLSGGTWDSATRRATYRTIPDKEPPLWNPYSPIVYWWTATEVDELTALRIVYNGRVIPTPKKVGWGYLGFRAVRQARP